MKSIVQIGTCGFHSTKEEYADIFSVVEVQQTFYQPPQIKTLEKWRLLVPTDFEFTIKAWQLITHEAKSPTFRRLTRNLTDQEKAEAGYFKPTAIVKEAWETTLMCAKALRVKTILFQCPASFRQTRENISNLEMFFSSVKREALNFAWEPRGDWNSQTVKSICRNLELWHTVDPFSKKTETPDKCYYRLHGRGGFRYKYEEDELTELYNMLPIDTNSYVFFNNKYMVEDALIFRRLAQDFY
ncbi:MAG: DUF72 domain-containing protein [Actinomycetota bacterium]